MNKFTSLFGVIFLVAITSLSFGQLAEKDTSNRGQTSVQKQVELFLGAHYKVVSLNGTAQTVQITKGEGVLTGYDIVSASNGGAITTIEQIKVYDLASTSGLLQSSASVGGVLPDSSKIIPDILEGPINVASLGGVFTSASIANVRSQEYRHPIRFENGITISIPANATHGAVSFRWKK